jgi:DNA-binding transcriptional regulator YdaS (Cro superfamily)
MSQKFKKLTVESKFNLWLNRAMKSKTPTPLERAVGLAGGVASLATACRVSVQAVYKWLKKGYPPVERCQAIEKAAAGQVTRVELLAPAFKPKRKPK